MASLYERSNGTLYANFRHEGERTRFSLKTKDKTEARRKLAELEDACRKGAFNPNTDDPWDYDNNSVPLTCDSAIEKFAAEKERQGRAERTVGTYRSVWGRFMDRVGGETKLSDLTVGDLHDYIHDRSVSDSTQHKRWRHVRAVLKWADCDIVENVDSPQRPDKLPTPVRKDDLSAVIDALKEDYREKRRKRQCQPGQMIWAVAVFRFTFLTGLRSSEIGRLKWKHIDRDRGLIRIERQKNGRQQTIPLISKAADVLNNAPRPRGPECYVFRAPGGPLRERNAESFGRTCSRTFCNARKESDVEGKTFHDLRAGFATALADAGMSAHKLKDAMRHADLSTALKYVKVSRQNLRSEMEGAF